LLESQHSMLGIGPDCCCVRIGSIQPMKHAKTAIHREVNVAIHALNVCNITFSLYSPFLGGNLKGRAIANHR
jgi:hypothetical protein